MQVLAIKSSNILLPWPRFIVYQTTRGHNGIEIWFHDLIPMNNLDVDLDQVEALADGKIVATIIINPSNHCSVVFSYEQRLHVCYNFLQKK